jgi:hypothetical protein
MALIALSSINPAAAKAQWPSGYFEHQICFNRIARGRRKDIGVNSHNRFSLNILWKSFPQDFVAPPFAPLIAIQDKRHIRKNPHRRRRGLSAPLFDLLQRSDFRQFPH